MTYVLFRCWAAPRRRCKTTTTRSSESRVLRSLALTVNLWNRQCGTVVRWRPCQGLRDILSAKHGSPPLACQRWPHRWQDRFLNQIDKNSFDFQSLLASQTGLSPYLRFGCLSTRLFYHALSDLYRCEESFSFSDLYRLWWRIILIILTIKSCNCLQENKEMWAPSLPPRATALARILLLCSN